MHVRKIVPGGSAPQAISLGGDSAYIEQWPCNPDGEPLRLIVQIDCQRFGETVFADALPATGMLYVFSTYSASDYFLDSITYSGDPSELALIRSGYTTVIHSTDRSALQTSPVASIPLSPTQLLDTPLDAEDFPAFSLTADKPWRVMNDVDRQLPGLRLVMQLYSADFPAPFKDIFFSTSAVGYLFVCRETPSRSLFFVQVS